MHTVIRKYEKNKLYNYMIYNNILNIINLYTIITKPIFMTKISIKSFKNKGETPVTHVTPNKMIIYMRRVYLWVFT